MGERMEKDENVQGERTSQILARWDECLYLHSGNSQQNLMTTGARLGHAN